MISILDLFKIGLGPSSSHTVGPMVAARRFALAVRDAGAGPRVRRLQVDLFGSLGATGRGHGTDRAVILGMEGAQPDTVDPDGIEERLAAIRAARALRPAWGGTVAFDEPSDLVFHRRRALDYHPNGMRMAAFDADGSPVLERTAYSVGGGFVVFAEDPSAAAGDDQDGPEVPHPFATGAELLARCKTLGMPVSAVILANERAWRGEDAIRAELIRRWEVMQECVERGCRASGTLPGGLAVKRRAPALYRELVRRPESSLRDPLNVLDWIDLYALAVSEENAGGGRVVTAPTNGAAGILPAVMHYADRFCATPPGWAERFLLTAGAIGILYKRNASISGADVGCQGEVGVACSMAAAALTEFLNGTPEQVEYAAEIGMEHNLGLTCDPVGGLVQVPCIERNAMGAIKAVNAARLALRSDGRHFVPLDRVIRTMYETGRDMKTKYKETARGGLAVNVAEC